MKREKSRAWVWVVVALALAAAWALWRRGADEAERVAEVPSAASAAPLAGAALTLPEVAIDLRAGERAAISGRVRDTQGRAIAGARVCAWPQSRLLATSEKRTPACADSGRDGHYRIEGLIGVAHRVWAGAPGFIPDEYARGTGAGRRTTVELRPGAEARDIDITLEGGGVEVAGHVKDLSGGAVEGAVVTSGHGLATSDAEGAFALWVRPGRTSVNAQADGYAPGSDDGVAPGHAFEVFLTPEAVIVGRVVRAGGGEPVEGARVTATSSEDWNDAATFSDAGGNFRLDGLRPGAFKPRAEADDAVGMAAEQVILGLGETSAPVVIEAHPAFMVEGRVVTDGGDVCDLGSVSLDDNTRGASAYASVEADGVVKLRGLRPGEYSVDVECRGFLAQDRYERVKLSDRSLSGLKWVVARGQAIRGTVVDAAGKGVPRIQLWAQKRLDPGDPKGREGYGQAQSEGDGRFEFTGLRAGEYTVRTSGSRDGRAEPEQPLTVQLDAGKDVDGLRVELPATGAVRGKVRDERGQPVARVSVGLGGGKQRYSVNAADDGSFAFERVGAGEYRATVRRGSDVLRAPGTGADDLQGQRVTVRVGATETVDLVVEGLTGALSGEVQAEGGPVVDAFVEATRESDSATAASGAAARSGRGWGMPSAPVLTDQDGRFTATGLAPGKYTVRAYRRGGGEAIREHVELGSQVVLTIAAPGRLEGTVTAPGSGPPEQFSVSLHDERTGYRRQDTFHRTGGAWGFSEVPQGSFKLGFSAGEGAQELKVDLGEGETKSLKVELNGRVTVRGVVTDLEGRPVPGVRVNVNGGGSSSLGGWSAEETQNVTDETGRFEVPRAPVGQVRVTAWPQDRGDAFEVGVIPAAIAAGAGTVELPPIRLVRRRVKDGEVAGDLGYSLKVPEPGADPLAYRAVVAVVRPGGPAAAAGLVVGDEIATVDGHPVSGANSSLLRGLTRVTPGTTLTLGLARGVTLQVAAGDPP